MNARTPLVDWVPRSNRFYVRFWLAAAAIVGMLEIGYWAMPLLNGRTTDGRVAALDLDEEGSLAVWVSSFTLLAAAGATLIVHVLQRDAGAGVRRRLWLWAAACWTVMSIDECSSLHEAFKELMSHATGARLVHDGTVWWVGAYFLVLAVTGLQLLWAMRRNLESCAALVGVALFYGTAVLCELGLLSAKDRRGVMVEEGCEMLGNFCLLTAMLLFARFQARRCRDYEIRATRLVDVDGVPVAQRSGRYVDLPATCERADIKRVPQVM
jgi:hypothetical protein